MKRPSRAEGEAIRDAQVTMIRAAELFHESGVSLPTRTIYMGSAEVDNDGNESGTDAKMTERFLKNLHILESISHDPVWVIMNNVGGCEYSGAAMYDAILLSECHVTIKARGHAMSMGSVILQAANDRVMSPSAMQMIHYGTWGVGAQHPTDNLRNAQEGQRWNTWMEDIYLRRMRQKDQKFSRAKLQQLLTFDTYLTAEQSIELGLADRIG